MQNIATVTLVVREYDEAIAYFVQTLGFQLLEDTPLTPEKRWVRVAPTTGGGPALLLARAKNDQERQAIGNQTGGRVAFFLQTDDFPRDYQAYQKAGVRFLEEPRQEPYGKVAVFQDCFGNRWDLVEYQ